jgi:TusA-related sulfurtransferase
MQDGLPLAWTAVTIATLRPGALVEVLVADPRAVADFSAWCRVTGNRLLEHTTEDGVLRLVIRKRELPTRPHRAGQARRAP